MIISYIFKNYKSFKDENTFYMTPVNKIKSFPENVLAFDFKHNLIKDSKNKLLKIAAISGQNASGKSNFVDSIEFMKKMVLKSFENIDNETNGKNNTIISEHQSFMYLEEVTPSFFELNFIMNGINYTYGFELNKNEIVSEWLEKNDKGVDKLFFKRTYEKVIYGNKTNVKDNSKKIIKNILKQRKEALLLSLFITLGENGKNNEIKDVFEYFRRQLKIYNDEVIIPKVLAEISAEEIMESPEKVSSTLRLIKLFIKSLDSRIVDLEVSEDLNQEYPFISVHEYVLSNGVKKQKKLPFSQESEGTKKLLRAAFFIIDTLTKKNSVLIIDEFDDKIHTNLFIEIIKVFQESKSQFIFATHNPYILEHDLLRKDQIYFVDKNSKEESSLYSLSDFKGVRTTESYQKRYLNGNYGAVPIIDFSEFKSVISLGDANGKK